MYVWLEQDEVRPTEALYICVIFWVSWPMSDLCLSCTLVAKWD